MSTHNKSQTLVEKIVQKHVLDYPELVHAGDFVRIAPKHIMTHDNTSGVMLKFDSIGVSEVFNSRQPVFAIDHDIQNTTPENLGKYAKIEKFARTHDIDFYPAGTGISHQVMVEEGYVIPGSMVVGSDSHSNLYGGVAALGTPVVRTDAAAIWATGETWWQVPQMAKVTLTGELQAGVVGKDVIIALCGLFNNDEVLNMAVEFTGNGLALLSMDQRLSIANMTTEWGALAGVLPFDEVLREALYKRADYLARRAGKKGPRFTRDDVDHWWADRLDSDPDAHYATELELDLSTVIPHVSGPDHVKVMRALPEIEQEQVKINKAYLLSCVNARLEDLQEAASIVAGKKVAEDVEFYVAAASKNVQEAASESGHWQQLLEAGAIPLPPGCGTCIGLGAGTLKAGEIGISATNRNFKGRMGSRDAQAYLASPAVVAASALAGHICAPRNYVDQKASTQTKLIGARTSGGGSTTMAEGFPVKMSGRVLWLDIDNLNTDGIYSGKLTYRDDVTEQEMAAAAMANYDPGFAEMARPGDIIVAGRNFGTGSSREQAVISLQAGGIQCVIASSFSQTYKRNAINNGFIVLDCAELVDWFRAQEQKNKALTVIGPEITIDFVQATILIEDQTYQFTPLGAVPQEVIAAGGAEALVAKKLAKA